MTDESDEFLSKHSLVGVGLEVLDGMKLVLDLLDGVRAEAMSRGYTKEQSTQMGADMFHSIMWSQKESSTSSDGSD